MGKDFTIRLDGHIGVDERCPAEAVALDDIHGGVREELEEPERAEHRMTELRCQLGRALGEAAEGPLVPALEQRDPEPAAAAVIADPEAGRGDGAAVTRADDHHVVTFIEPSARGREHEAPPREPPCLHSGLRGAMGRIDTGSSSHSDPPFKALVGTSLA